MQDKKTFIQGLPARLQAGDKQAFIDFSEEFSPIFYQFFLSKGLPPLEAQDLTATCRADILSKVIHRKYEPNAGSFYGWVQKIMQTSAEKWSREQEYRRTEPLTDELAETLQVSYGVAEILGLAQTLKAETDLVAVVEEQIPVSAIPALLQHGILAEEIYSIVVPRRTLKRRLAREEKLSREESDRAVRLARLVTLAEKVFGDPAAGMGWLRSPKKRFRGRTPMDMITTETGSHLVEEALYQIDEGMAA